MSLAALYLDPVPDAAPTPQRLRAHDVRSLPDGAVLIHAGQHKTGSTALQNTLALNRDALAPQGWLYPLNGLVAQEHVGFRHLGLMMEILRGGACPGWARLRDEIAGQRGRVLLSHENFFSPQIEPRRVAAELRGREVFVIVYLRHPADYVESCYREWVRRLSFAGSAAQYAEARRPWLEIERLVATWEAAIGAGHVLLRPYERRQFNGGTVLSDFLHLLGAQLPDLLEGRGNDSLNPRQTLVHLVGNAKGAPQGAVQALVNLLGSAEQTQQALAGLEADAAHEALQPQKVAALRCLLQGVLPRARVLDDATFAEIERRYLPQFQAALATHGTPGDVIGESVYAALPHDASFASDELRAAIRLLLG
jgi:hypothetical protein